MYHIIITFLPKNNILNPVYHIRIKYQSILHYLTKFGKNLPENTEMMLNSILERVYR